MADDWDSFAQTQGSTAPTASWDDFAASQAPKPPSFLDKLQKGAGDALDMANPMSQITGFVSDPKAEAAKDMAFLNGGAKMVPGAEKAAAGVLAAGDTLANGGGLQGLSDNYNNRRDEYKQNDAMLTSQNPGANFAGNVAGTVATLPAYGETYLLPKMGFAQAASDSKISPSSDPVGFGTDVGIKGAANTVGGKLMGMAGSKLAAVGADTKVAQALKSAYASLIPSLQQAIDKGTYEGANDLSLSSLDRSGQLAQVVAAAAKNPALTQQIGDSATHEAGSLDNFNQNKIQPLYNSVNTTPLPEKPLNPAMLGLDAPRSPVTPRSVTSPGSPAVAPETTQVTLPDPRGGSPINRTIQTGEGSPAIPPRTTNFSGQPGSSSTPGIDDFLAKNPAVAQAVANVKTNMGQSAPQDTMSLLKYARDDVSQNPTARNAITDFMRQNGAPQIDSADSLHKYYLGDYGNGSSPAANLRLIQGGVNAGQRNVAKGVINDVGNKTGIGSTIGNVLRLVKGISPASDMMPAALKSKGMDTKSLGIMADLLQNPNPQAALAQISQNPSARQNIARFLPYLGVNATNAVAQQVAP